MSSKQNSCRSHKSKSSFLSYISYIYLKVSSAPLPDGTVQVTWEYKDDNLGVQGFRVYAFPWNIGQESPFFQDCLLSSRSIIFKGLVSGVPFLFQVVAFGANCHGIPSISSCLTIPVGGKVLGYLYSRPEGIIRPSKKKVDHFFRSQRVLKRHLSNTSTADDKWTLCNSDNSRIQQREDIKNKSLLLLKENKAWKNNSEHALSIRKEYPKMNSLQRIIAFR